MPAPFRVSIGAVVGHIDVTRHGAAIAVAVGAVRVTSGEGGRQRRMSGFGKRYGRGTEADRLLSVELDERFTDPSSTISTGIIIDVAGVASAVLRQLPNVLRCTPTASAISFHPHPADRASSANARIRRFNSVGVLARWLPFRRR